MNHKAKKPRNKFINKIRRYFYPVENVIIMALSYLFSALNFFAAGLYSSRLEQDGMQGILICLGCIMLIMIPISIVDDYRKNSHSWFSAVGGIIMHLALCFGIAVVYSYEWMLVYWAEVFIGFVAVVIGRKYW